MRPTLAISVAAFALAIMRAAPADAAGIPETSPAKQPRVYALIAAVGNEFSIVQEGTSTGTHLSPYRRTTTEVPDNILNRMALNGLDRAIAQVDPQSKRVYLTLPAAQVDKISPPERDNAAIAAIVAALQQVPQRTEWDRIVIATPAYRALANDGLPSQLQGFGLFSEPQCQAGCATILRNPMLAAVDSEPLDGVSVVTSDDKIIKAKTFLAPFSYIAVWVLDPKTLAVLDRQQGFDHQKLGEPAYKPAINLEQSAGRKYMAARISRLIELSVGEAVMHSEVNGSHATVEVGDVKEVPAADTKR